MNRCIINTHRFGDILLNLPIAKAWADAGDNVWWCVHSHFADVVNAVSYVKPIVFQGDMNDAEDAERAARNIAPKDSEFICLQAKVLRTGGAKCHRFSVEPWANAGLLERFHELPLILDRRDTSRDAETLAKHWPTSGKPVLALCLKGYSSNPENCGWGKNGTEDFRQWIKFHAQSVLGWDVLDLGELKLRNILDLVPLLAGSVALLTVDTALLHLSYATLTPTYALSAGTEWDKSEPRTHWIGQSTYAESKTPAGREAIARALGQRPPYPMGSMVRTSDEMRCRPITHCYNNAPTRDHTVAHRNALARGSWDQVNWSGWRSKPYPAKPARLKEWVASFVQSGDWSDMMVLATPDAALVPDSGIAIARETAKSGCCFSTVVDLEQVTFMHSRESLPNTGGSESVYAFTVDWWKGFGDQVSDVVIGQPGWDAELKRIMAASNLTAELKPPIAYRQMKPPIATINVTIPPAELATGKIIQVVHRYNAPEDEHRRNMAALPTLEAASKRDGNWIVVEHTIGNSRSSADVGDHRNLPYIVDLFDFAVNYAEDSDILLLANSDIQIVPEAGRAIRETLAKIDCAYCWRITVPAEQMTLDRRKLATIRTDFGIDLFACRKSWWLKVRSDYPMSFLGCTGWDVVLRKLMDREGAYAEIRPPIYCHEAHESYWKIHSDNPANVHNLKLWDEWEKANQWQTTIAV